MSSSQSTNPSSLSQELEEPPLFHFASLRGSGDKQDSGEFEDGKVLGPEEYVAVIADAMKMLKNVVLARYFNNFDRSQALLPSSSSPGKGGVFVDVWPVNLLRPDSSSYVDTCSLFLLQLACILNMVRAWRKATLRLFLCVEEGRSVKGSEEKLGQLLKDLRIKAQVYPVPWDQVVALHWQRQGGWSRKQQSTDPSTDESAARAEEDENQDDYVNSFPSNTTRLSDDYLSAVNKLILDQTRQPPAVRFLYLPRPPADTRGYTAYLQQLDLLTQDLGPTLLIHGVTPVITTDLWRISLCWSSTTSPKALTSMYISVFNLSFSIFRIIFEDDQNEMNSTKSDLSDYVSESEVPLVLCFYEQTLGAMVGLDGFYSKNNCLVGSQDNIFIIHVHFCFPAKCMEFSKKQF